MGKASALVKNLKAGDDLSAFHDGFKLAIEEGKDGPSGHTDRVSFLLRVRDYVESWVSGKDLDQQQAWMQWNDVYHTGAQMLPDSFLETVIRRFPKFPKGAIDARTLALESKDKRFIKFLLLSGVLRASDLQKLAKSDPSRFYQSASLDVSIDRKIKVPRTVWKGALSADARSSGLAFGVDLLVRAFTMDSGKDAVIWLVNGLATSGATRVHILQQIARAPGITLKLTHGLVCEYWKPGVVSEKSWPLDTTEVILDWLTICQEKLEFDERFAGGSLIFGFLRLIAFIDRQAIPKEISEIVTQALQNSNANALVTLLRSEESGNKSQGDLTALVVVGSEIYRAVQEYIQSLPSGQGNESPERALRIERYKGRRDIIEGLISAIDEFPQSGPLANAVEVALFNAGVRSIGKPGESTTFDGHIHEPESSGLLAGDPVCITSAGRMLGSPEEGGIVLRRMRVKKVL